MRTTAAANPRAAISSHEARAASSAGVSRPQQLPYPDAEPSPNRPCPAAGPAALAGGPEHAGGEPVGGPQGRHGDETPPRTAERSAGAAPPVVGTDAVVDAAAATMGASSSSTRVSLTITATASAEAPRSGRWRLPVRRRAPRRLPTPRRPPGLSPSGPMRRGRTPMASVPQRVTSAIGSTCPAAGSAGRLPSRRSRRPPQIANPVAISSETGAAGETTADA